MKFPLVGNVFLLMRAKSRPVIIIMCCL